tara:strand:+ start:820 stop:1281 length:462 start_codon:yes stop_codon:yes gene_type:complete
MQNISDVHIPETSHQLLKKSIIGTITTIRHNDQLLSSHPVSFVWDGDSIRISSLKNRIKYKNILADARVSFCVVSATNVMDYLEVRGYATLEDDPDRVFARRQFVESSGGDEPPADMDPPDAERVIITIHPQQVSSPKLYGGRFDNFQASKKS